MSQVGRAHSLRRDRPAGNEMCIRDRFVVDLLLPIDAAAPVEQVFVWESAKEALL